MVGNNTEVSQNPKSKTTICPSNPSPGVYRKQPTKLKTCVHANVHSSVIYNSQDMEATWVHKQMSRSKRCDLYTHTHSHTVENSAVLSCSAMSHFVIHGQ